VVNYDFKPVQSLQRGLRMLEIIAGSREGVSLKELAKGIGCSTPAAFHLVHTLVDGGFATREENPVRYRLGEQMRRLVESQQRDRFSRIARNCMCELGRKLPGASIYLSEYIGGSVVVRAYLSSSGSEPAVFEENNRILPPYASAGSLAHLAFWSQEIREDYETRYPFVSYGIGYWRSRARYDEALRELRESRMFVMPEPSPLTLKLALPLFYPSGALSAALTVHGNLKSAAGMARKRKELLAAAQNASETFTQKLAQ
jgi:IclR family acetate operon transcriptional repressor